MAYSHLYVTEEDKSEIQRIQKKLGYRSMIGVIRDALRVLDEFDHEDLGK